MKNEKRRARRILPPEERLKRAQAARQRGMDALKKPKPKPKTPAQIKAEKTKKGMDNTKVPRWTQELKKVLRDNPATFALTLKELCVMVNHGLKKHEQIKYEHLANLQNPNSNRYAGDMSWITQEQKDDFLDAIEFSKVQQKLALTEKMMDDENSNKWGTAWLLERKFGDLKLKQDIQIGAGGITLQIEGGGSVQNSLDAIETIEFEDVTDQKLLG